MVGTANEDDLGVDEKSRADIDNVVDGVVCPQDKDFVGTSWKLDTATPRRKLDAVVTPERRCGLPPIMKRGQRLLRRMYRWYIREG
jgi:hypothetical protein